MDKRAAASLRITFTCSSTTSTSNGWPAKTSAASDFIYKFRDPLLESPGGQLYRSLKSPHAVELLYIESLINTLCYHLIQHYSTRQPTARAGQRLPAAALARIDAYLESSADQPVTLMTLTELANLSLYHFVRCFKRTTGQTPYQYVLDWKIRRASHWLQRGDKPISAISDALGFATPAHFPAVFKRKMGQLPRDFRHRG